MYVGKEKDFNFSDLNVPEDGVECKYFTISAID